MIIRLLALWREGGQNHKFPHTPLSGERILLLANKQYADFFVLANKIAILHKHYNKTNAV